MSMWFAGYPCLDADDLSKQCRQLGLPTIAFEGRANSFSNSLGGPPSYGWILVTRETLNELQVGTDGTDTFQELVLSSELGEITFPKILFTGEAVNITPGGRDDPNSAYCVRIADKRWLFWERGEPVFQAYNCRSDADGSYVDSTLNGASAWTWDELLADIWPTSMDPVVPDLPFIPDGTPETFWYQGETQLEAVHHLLSRLCCALKYDPVADSFTIVQLGETSDAVATVLERLNEYRLHDLEPKTTQTVQIPKTIRVQHRVKKGYTDGQLPYYTHDVTVDPAAATLGDNTYVLLKDDLTALWDGSTITNLTDLEDRRDERAADFIRKSTYLDRGDFLIFSHYHDMMDVLGGEWLTVMWKELGGDTELTSGITTQIASGAVADTMLPDWWRHETIDVKIGQCSDGQSGSSSGNTDSELLQLIRLARESAVGPVLTAPSCATSGSGTGSSSGDCGYTGSMYQVIDHDCVGGRWRTTRRRFTYVCNEVTDIGDPEVRTGGCCSDDTTDCPDSGTGSGGSATGSGGVVGASCGDCTIVANEYDVTFGTVTNGGCSGCVGWLSGRTVRIRRITDPSPGCCSWTATIPYPGPCTGISTGVVMQYDCLINFDWRIAVGPDGSAPNLAQHTWRANRADFNCLGTTVFDEVVNASQGGCIWCPTVSVSPV